MGSTSIALRYWKGKHASTYAQVPINPLRSCLLIQNHRTESKIKKTFSSRPASISSSSTSIVPAANDNLNHKTRNMKMRFQKMRGMNLEIQKSIWILFWKPKERKPVSVAWDFLTIMKFCFPYVYSENPFTGNWGTGSKKQSFLRGKCETRHGNPSNRHYDTRFPVADNKQRDLTFELKCP